MSGKNAAEIELINCAVPFDSLEKKVNDLAHKLIRLPLSQLAAMKLVVNKAYENMGIANTQVIGTLLDGYMRNTPEGKEFLDTAIKDGEGAAIQNRDEQFGDYSFAKTD